MYYRQNLQWLRDKADESIAAIDAARGDLDDLKEARGNAVWYANDTFQMKQFGLRLLTNMLEHCYEGRGWVDQYDDNGKMVNISLTPMDTAPHDFQINAYTASLRLASGRDK
jgi:hypothetical protein